MENIVRTDYDLQQGNRYRQLPKGDSTPTDPKWIAYDKQLKAQKRKEARKGNTTQASAAVAQPQPVSAQPSVTTFTEREKAIIQAFNAYYGESLGEGQKHSTFCQQTAHWLCWLVDNNPEKAIAMAYELN